MRTTQIVVDFRSVPSARSDAISSSSAVPILLISSPVHAAIGVTLSLELDQDFYRFALIHRPVAIRHIVEAGDPIKDSPRLNPAFEDIRQQLLNVRAGRGRSAAHGEVVVECWLRCRDCLVVRHTNAAYCTTWTSDAHCGVYRLLSADTLKDGVNAKTLGEIAHALYRLLASFPDDVGCAKRFRQCDPVRMTAQQNDLLGTKSPG